MSMTTRTVAPRAFHVIRASTGLRRVAALHIWQFGGAP